MKTGRGLRCRPWRASARLRPPPRHTQFSLASFLPILNCFDYNKNPLTQENGSAASGGIVFAAYGLQLYFAGSIDFPTAAYASCRFFRFPALPQAERGNQTLEEAGLRGEFLAGGSALLTGGGVGLYHTGNLVNTLGYLIDGGCLLFHRFHHDGHLRCHTPRADAGALQGLSDLVHDAAALGHSGDGAFDQILGGLGGFVRLVGQVANLVGNHGKALSGGSGTGRLHSGVQRQNICLESNVLDCGNDLADLLGGAGDFAHRHVELLDIFHADAQLAACLLDKLAGFPGGLGGPLGVSGDVADGGGEFLYGTGLLRGALGQGLSAVGYLLGAVGYLHGALPNPAHGIIEPGQDAVQGNSDGYKISHIFLPGGSGQIPGGNGIQRRSNLADVGPETMDRFLKYVGQLPNLVIRLDGDGALPAAVQAQIALLQAAGHLGDLGQRGRNGLSQIRCHEKDTRNDDGEAHQRGPDYRHKDLAVGVFGGDTGKDQSVDHAGVIPGGNVGTQVFFVQDGCLAYIALSLLQNNFGQLCGQRGPHGPLPVLDHSSVGPGIPLENGKLTAHAAFQIIQQLIDIVCAAGLAQNIIQHIGSIGAALFQHP